MSITIFIVFLLACNFATQPINDAQNLAQTAQAVASSIPMETIQAIGSVIPAETLQALPSMAPTLEALASSMPDIGNMLNPQGTPLQEWRGVPVMPQAVAGQEFSENNTYSFRANAAAEDVQNFYNTELTALGWSQPFSFPFGPEGGAMAFRKDQSSLAVTVIPSEGSVVVLLVLTQA
jgi:hypothetical protein